MPLRPICFMVMPFSTKDTQAAPTAPSRVNFDALWEKVLRPVLDELGYQPVRADQDLGALIVKEMLERLYFSDLVVADMTIPNGNVYYEVGIRHAARNGGCVLVSADWTKTLFDVDQMRQVRYPLPEGDISDATAAAARLVLKDAIPALAPGDSPMFQTLQGYPTSVDPDRATSIRAFLEELSSFQASVRAVRIAPKAEQRALALAIRDQHASQQPEVPAVSLEVLYLLRDFADWRDTMAYIDALPDSLRCLPVVREQRCLAQSKTGDHRDAIGALQELVKTTGATSEREGLIGGRYKKLFAAATDPADKARFLSEAIDHYERGVKLDLNDYYPSSNLPRLYRLRGKRGDDERARGAATLARMACERAKERNPSDEWVRPTLIGMAFDAGDVVAAEDLYDQLLQEGPAVWKLETTLADLDVAVAQTKDAEVKAGLQAVLDNLRTLVR
jgi:hypothetical protein